MIKIWVSVIITPRTSLPLGIKPERTVRIFAPKAIRARDCNNKETPIEVINEVSGGALRTGLKVVFSIIIPRTATAAIAKMKDSHKGHWKMIKKKKKEKPPAMALTPRAMLRKSKMPK